MRAMIELDETLLREALNVAPAATESEVISLALSEFVQNHRRALDIRDLYGTGGIREDYDYKAVRTGDPS